MHRYILHRLLLTIPTLLGVAVIVFVLMRVIPGDIVEMRFAEGRFFNQEIRDNYDCREITPSDVRGNALPHTGRDRRTVSRR